MARPNSGDNPLTGPLAPYQTQPGGMLAPPAGPYGPPVTVPGGTTAKAPPTPLGLLNALRRRWVLATFLGLLVGSALGMGVWFALPSGKHTARSIVQLRPSSVEAGNRQVEDFESFRRSQMFLVRSRDLINRTLADPKIASLPTVREAEDPVRLLEDGIRVDGSVAPDLMVVSFSGDNKEDLLKLVNGVVARYVDDAILAVRNGHLDREERLRKLSDELKAQVNSQEIAIRRMAEANGTIGAEDTNGKENALTLMTTQLTADVTSLKLANGEKDVKIGLLKEKLKLAETDPAKVAADPLVLREQVDQHPRVAQLLAKKAATEVQLSSAKARAGGVTNAPVVVALEAELAQTVKDLAVARAETTPGVKDLITEFAQQVVRSQLIDMEDRLTADAAILRHKEEMLAALQKNVGTKARAAFDIASLMKGLDPMRNRLHQLEDQRIQIAIEKGMEARVSVREPAVLIMNQNFRQKMMMGGAAGVAGFLGVLGLIAMIEWRNRRVDGVDQVVTDLGMRVIGTVPAFPNRASLKAAELAGNANWRFILNESINSTRTMLLHTARSQSMQVVMVTSATQGEGKTSLASQLGSSMATAGMRTLIVDCDLRNPSIHKLFDLTLTPGVSEVLCQDADPSDAVQPTAVPNLWVIPAGQCSTRVIAALAQGHPLETLFNRLRGQFDFVVVDSCPVLPVADALLIGQHVDGVVFSIMQDVSQLPKVMVASEKLHQLSINLLGAVVNGVHMGSAYYAYGYNYVKQLPA
ncbi:polysaccharide biosynthesis tyrosine autokinase [bacterium]|nr:polysaccharide biosynthesis tyrosine autokinase [bacterium]